MTTPDALFFFDLLDPLSFLLDRELEALEEIHGAPLVEGLPLELRPPPEPLLDPDDAAWRARWEEPAVRGVSGLTRPDFVPWTRKAHELVAHAAFQKLGPAMRRRLFRAGLHEGRDIGRVDVLVELAAELGFERSATKAVLDVDKHAATVEGARARAQEAGIVAPPALVAGPAVLRGFHNRDALRTFLAR